MFDPSILLNLTAAAAALVIGAGAFAIGFEGNLRHLSNGERPAPLLAFVLVVVLGILMTWTLGDLTPYARIVYSAVWVLVANVVAALVLGWGKRSAETRK